MTYISTPITRQQAEASLKALKAQYAGCFEPTELDGKQLQPPFDPPELVERFDDGPHWAITWDGPEDWEIHAFHGRLDSKAYRALRDEGVEPREAAQKASRNTAPIPDGVFPEPIRPGVLGLYPECKVELR
jgi:hypothetical protein